LRGGCAWYLRLSSRRASEHPERDRADREYKRPTNHRATSNHRAIFNYGMWASMAAAAGCDRTALRAQRQGAVARKPLRSARSDPSRGRGSSRICETRMLGSSGSVPSLRARVWASLSSTEGYVNRVSSHRFNFVTHVTTIGWSAGSASVRRLSATPNRRNAPCCDRW
jgi:hypothetical protein